MRNNVSTFINNFYFWKLTNGVFEDCISISQNSIKRRNEVKNGKNHYILSVMRKQRLDYLKDIISGQRLANL